jgi:hypothetical protein
MLVCTRISPDDLQGLVRQFTSHPESPAAGGCASTCGEELQYIRRRWPDAEETRLRNERIMSATAVCGWRTFTTYKTQASTAHGIALA